MNATDSAAQKEAMQLLRKMSVVHLATCKDNIPQVRPVTLIPLHGKFWITTDTNSTKAAHIRENKNVEFCLFMGMDEKMQHKGYLRGASVAHIISDPEIRKHVAENTPFSKTFWQTPEDPGFTLLQIEIKNIEYMKPQGTEVFRFSL